MKGRISRPPLIWVALVVVLVSSGCGSGPSANYYHLPDGSVVNIEGPAIYLSTEGERFLQLKYQTSIPIESKDELRAQAEQIWMLFEPDVEAEGYNRASLLAANKRTVYGFSKRPVHLYLLYRQVNGTWSWGKNRDITG